MFGTVADTVPTFDAWWNLQQKRQRDRDAVPLWEAQYGRKWWGAPVPQPDLSANPFRQYKNVKEEDVDLANRNLLKDWTSLSTSPEANKPQFGTYTRSPDLAKKIKGQFDLNDVDTQNSRQSVADFASSILGAEAPEMAQFEKESGAINQWYDPNGLEAQLAGQRNALRTSATQNLQNRIGNIGAAANRARLMGGTDSSVNAAAMNAVGQASLGLNQALAEQRLRDTMALAQGRASLAGRVNDLRNQILMRRQIPIQLQQQVNAGNLARFGQLAGLDLNNQMVYQLPTAYDLMARKIAGTGELGRNIIGGTEYTYEAPRDMDTTGSLPQSQPRTQGPAQNPMQRPIDPRTGWALPWASQEAVALPGGGVGARAGGQPTVLPWGSKYSGVNPWYQESPGYYPYLGTNARPGGVEGNQFSEAELAQAYNDWMASQGGPFGDLGYGGGGFGDLGYNAGYFGG